MGKGKVAKVPVVKPKEETSRDPIKVNNLYEIGALKGALDEVAREVILDSGYEEDVVISNVKIALGLMAIACAAFSHFGPGKFPSNWWMVLGCVVAYLVLTFVMNLYSWKLEGDSFLVTKPFRGSKGLRVSSRINRDTQEYLLVLTDRADPNLEVQGCFRLSELFHADGYLADTAWRGEVEKLGQQMTQQYTKKSD